MAGIREAMRKAAIQRYDAAVDKAKIVLKDADPRPGAMTAEQETAQRDVINAYLAIPEKTLYY